MKYLAAQPELVRSVPIAVASAGALLGMVLFLPAATWVPLVWLITGAALIVAWISAVADPDDRGSLIIGALLGLVVRASAAWVISDYAYRYVDPRLYWYLGTRVADLLSQPSITDVNLTRAVGTATWGYYFWVALHVFILRDQILTTLSNALIGVASGVMIYLIGRRVWSSRAGLGAAWLVWCSSAMIVVDAHSLRDSGATLAGLAVVYGAQQLAERWSVRGLLWFVIGLSVLLQFRNYVAMLLMVVALVAILLIARRARLTLLLFLLAAGSIVGAVVATTDIVVIIGKFSRGDTLVDLLKYAQIGLVGVRPSTSAFSGIQLQTLREMILFTPIGMGRILFAPLPWLPVRVDVVFIPDVIVRYAVLPFFGVGFWAAVRWGWRRTGLVALVLLAEMVVYSVIELGGNVRHNTQFFPYHFLFVAIGWSVAQRYREALFVGYIFMSLPLWIYGLTLSMSLWYFPLVFALLSVWWIVNVRFLRQRESVAGA